MSHDMQAAWATSEVAHFITHHQDSFFKGLGTSGEWSLYASRENKREWPLADGIIVAENATNKTLKIALEYKRTNEGVHGILTALGQSYAYIEKGYCASVIVIPKTYESHPSPGQHVNRIINRVSPNAPISIFTYDEPNVNVATPFRDRIDCVRELQFLNTDEKSKITESSHAETLWMHLREGSSDPDAFFKYCQLAKKLSIGNEENDISIILPESLNIAIQKLSPDADPYKFLSNTIGDTLLDKTWREFWFTYVFHKDAIPIWKTDNGIYSINKCSSKIVRSDGSAYKAFFVGRSDSLKNKLVDKLNKGLISEKEAWIEYAQNVRNRSHSYREDIDSGLAAIGFLNDDGRLTDLGYKFVDSCERTGEPNKGISKAIFGSSILQNGQLGAFLFYIYKLSEDVFRSNPLAFTINDRNKYKFTKREYMDWILNKFANELFIYRKVAERGGVSREPFQAELAILRSLGFVRDYRIGVGLEINWPAVQDSMNFFNTL